MSKLTYTNIEYDFYDSDALSVYLDVRSSDNPDVSVPVEISYEVSVKDITVDFGYGEPTYVPYGSTSVMYDDGFEIYGVDASEAVSLYDVFICDADRDRLDDSANPEENAIVHNNTADLLHCTLEELNAFLAGLDKEFYSKVVDYLNNYYTENPDSLPDSAFKVDDWRDVDWD